MPLSQERLNSGFAHTVIDVHGERGRAWLEYLPDLLEECAQRWSLTLGQPFELSYNYVASAVRADGREVVLKAGVPCQELETEAEALAAYAGNGAVRLLDADLERGVLLLERLMPGDMLSSVADDDRATRIAAAVFRELRRTPPPGNTFPTVNDWAEGLRRLRARYDGGTGPFPARHVEEAEALFTDLLPSQGEPVLLHGDLHHFNILNAGERGWVAIDPKGVIGEAEYEIGALLRNPDPETLAQPEAVRMQKRRIEILAEELGFDCTRLRDWAASQAVLSGWWGVEDHGELSDTWTAVTERLFEVRF